ncbi:DUF6624 domain-containing protein [Sphaerisporangium fuscum]|uniref:DUF6624 domain-containing protein n=1 Tax=Sphaerisporangium fuscum TaxID=2835868 RepID=UPI001BDD1D07|nr:DUF6624 domain-containing protein [Sphaerisporangium fuscum]
MTDVLWEVCPPRTGARAKPLPPAAERVLSAVRQGRADGMFPPVMRVDPDGLLRVERHLAGEDDAGLVAHVLADDRFAPLVGLLSGLDAWLGSAARRHGDIVAPGVLDVTNAELVGPLITEALAACAADGDAGPLVSGLRSGFEASLSLFLRRLERDLPASWFEAPAFRPPVTRLWAGPAETHNGRRQVLRLHMSGGGRVAYKPRPANGESLFLADSPPARPASVFALLNELPPASGEIRLPVMACRDGIEDGRPAYLWQEWIEPPAQWGTVRADGELRLRGVTLGEQEAARFWHRAGSLTAACFGYGITDLGEGNVLAGARPGDTEPLTYPVDLEICFAPVRRLFDTGLVADADGGGSHHVGLERAAHWCTGEGDGLWFSAGPHGSLRLRRRSLPCAREETRSAVSDMRGRVGYGPYLLDHLRGMFDAWTLMCRHRERVRRLVHEAGEHYTRVLLKPTAAYGEALDRHAWSGSGFEEHELEQLRRRDVPYFFRNLDGGPLLYVDPPTGAYLPVGPQPVDDEGLPPSPTVRDGGNLNLAGLGVAIRDAVAYVYADLPERTLVHPGRGVRARLTGPYSGEVCFDWREADRRITYEWDRTTVRLRLDPLDPPAGAGEGVRRRLLRIDRLDASLRERWARGGFADDALGDRIGILTRAAVAWLRAVVDEHGWPGRALVGEEAAAAACRLVQHASGPRTFQEHCLELVREAARGGEASPRDVAYLTDALRVQDGRPQVYGTKFHQENGELVPLPIERAGQVDERRKAMGMEPLDEYAARLRRRFRTETS